MPDLGNWFKENKKAASYTAYQAEITLIFDDMEKAGLPQWILFDKLNEGVSKKIKAEVLAAGLERAYRQLLVVRDLFIELKIKIEDRALYEESLKTLSLYLAGGLNPELMRQLIRICQLNQTPQQAVLQLCEAILKIRQAATLEDRDLILLADALLNSSLPAAAYVSVSSLFVKGKIRHIREKTLINLITGILAQGGGLIQLNEELNRRIKK